MPKTDDTAAIRRAIVKTWFALDAIVALTPPLYWIADGATTPILGVPGALFYFLAISAFITASLIAGYYLEPEGPKASFAA